MEKIRTSVIRDRRFDLRQIQGAGDATRGGYYERGDGTADLSREIAGTEPTRERSPRPRSRLEFSREPRTKRASRSFPNGSTRVHVHASCTRLTYGSKPAANGPGGGRRRVPQGLTRMDQSMVVYGIEEVESGTLH